MVRDQGDRFHPARGRDHQLEFFEEDLEIPGVPVWDPGDKNQDSLDNW